MKRLIYLTLVMSHLIRITYKCGPSHVFIGKVPLAKSIKSKHLITFLQNMTNGNNNLINGTSSLESMSATPVSGNGGIFL